MSSSASSKDTMLTEEINPPISLRVGKRILGKYTYLETDRSHSIERKL